MIDTIQANDWTQIIIWLLVLFFLNSFLRFIRMLRLYSLARRLNLKYNKGNFFKLTLYKEVEYKRNIIKGYINGKEIEFFDLLKRRGVGKYYSYAIKSYIYIDKKLFYFPKNSVFDLNKIRPVSVKQIRETLSKI